MKPFKRQSTTVYFSNPIKVGKELRERMCDSFHEITPEIIAAVPKQMKLNTHFALENNSGYFEHF